MKRMGRKNLMAKITKGLLEKTLKLEANSTACIVMHQPKAPKGLLKFKEKND